MITTTRALNVEQLVVELAAANGGTKPSLTIRGPLGEGEEKTVECTDGSTDDATLDAVIDVHVPAPPGPTTQELLDQALARIEVLETQVQGL